ncbi:MAG: ATP-dependent Clp protease ATP-binding subunit [Eubacteriales bacterium]|nr:ATP-dependent Clp protease ATP-binding subunit [Eubacteriales bacterium]
MAQYNLSEELKRISDAALVEVRKTGNVVFSTHMLLGMLTLDCKAKELLLKFRVMPTVFKKVDTSSRSNVAVFSDELNDAFDMAERISVNAKCREIESTHLLLALLVTDSAVKQAFENDGYDYSKMKSFLTEKLSAGSLLATVEGKEDLGPLESFGYSMTARAKAGKIDPVIGRKDEIDRMIRILCRRTKNNPVLTGEAGVGKSAVVEGLCGLIAKNKVPDLLKGKIIFSLDIAGLLAGTRFRGEFEQKFHDAIDYIQNRKDIILFIDEIHNIIGAGSTGDSKMDIAEILKPILARGELQTIGATTADEYNRYIAKDAALERRFQVVNVEQPTVEQTFEILKGIRPKYEAHHGIAITDEALFAAAKLSDRYITDRYLPDKAVDVIDESASRTRLESAVASPQIDALKDRIAALTAQKEAVKLTDDFDTAKALMGKINQLNAELEKLRDSLPDRAKPIVTEETVAQTVSQWTGVPVSKLSESESEKLLNLEKTLSESVVGQEEAVRAVSTAMRRARAGLKDPKRPIGSFIFVGSTGVGKTELCKALAKNMFGDERDIITLDMSEYGEPNSVSKLIGAPPGFVGYEESGQLTEKVRRRPYSIVLFDEIEKANKDIFNIFLQILDEGRLTDNRGRIIDFKNTVIIMTSNVGADIATANQRMGYEQLRQTYMGALKKTFRPEFLNRVDDIIVFHPLTMAATLKIAEIFADKLCKRLEENGLHVTFTPSAIQLLAKKGYSAEYGARPLKRVIQRTVEDKLSEALLAQKIKKGDSIRIDAVDDRILFRK